MDECGPICIYAKTAAASLQFVRNTEASFHGHLVHVHTKMQREHHVYVCICSGVTLGTTVSGDFPQWLESQNETQICMS